MRKLFCINCRKFVEDNFDRRVVHETYEIKGHTLTMEMIRLFCKEYGEELYDPESHDANIDSLDKAWKEATGNG